MQPNLEQQIHPFLTTGETLVRIAPPNPQQYAQPTVLSWLGAVTVSTVLTLIAILWIDRPDALLLLFVPPFLLLATVIVKQDKEKEALDIVQVTTDQRRFTVNRVALAQSQPSADPKEKRS